MIIIADTTPLSELAKIGELDLLQKVYGQITIPKEVYQEITTGNHPAVKIIKANLILMDDREGRKVARSRNLSVTGTLGTLLTAKQLGIINEVKPLLEALINQGTRISPTLYQQVLLIAQEL